MSTTSTSTNDLSERLEQCRRLLLVVNGAATLATHKEVLVGPVEPHGCAKCGSTRLIYRDLTRAEAPARILVVPVLF